MDTQKPIKDYPNYSKMLNENAEQLKQQMLDSNPRHWNFIPFIATKAPVLTWKQTLERWIYQKVSRWYDKYEPRLRKDIPEYLVELFRGYGIDLYEVRFNHKVLSVDCVDSILFCHMAIEVLEPITKMKLKNELMQLNLIDPGIAPPRQETFRAAEKVDSVENVEAFRQAYNKWQKEQIVYRKTKIWKIPPYKVENDNWPSNLHQGSKMKDYDVASSPIDMESDVDLSGSSYDPETLAQKAVHRLQAKVQQSKSV